jgi:putative ABC transport system permease protein
MLLYNLRLAWKSLRRTPMLSALSVTAIGIGIAVAMVCVSVYHLLKADPLPDSSANLFLIRVDAWDPQRPYDDEFPERPPDQLTWRDAMALQASAPAARQTAMFRARLVAQPERAELKPFAASARLCYRHFFPMFEVPFQWGGPWSEAADANGEAVVVLSATANDQLFGSRNSVGEKLWIERRYFTVVGVLAPWRPPIRFYDPIGNAQGSPEELYLPMSLTQPMELQSNGNRSGWQSGGQTYAEFLQSEVIWTQFWAELKTPAEKAAYARYLDGYVAEQKKLGRHARPANSWIQPMMEWLDEAGAVPDTARTMTVLSLLFLLVVAVNLIGLLLGKFLARAPEVGVRRALGASRSSIFVQYLTECTVLGLLGGLLGLPLAAAGLSALNRMLGEDTAYRLDPAMLATAVLLSMVAGWIAGFYPAWRICATPPALHLKVR